jgi:hypothetical protein
LSEYKPAAHSEQVLAPAQSRRDFECENVNENHYTNREALARVENDQSKSKDIVRLRDK